MGVRYGTKYLARGLGGMFVYSLRDGFFGTYLRAVGAGARMAYSHRAKRSKWSPDTEDVFRRIDRDRPSLIWTIRERLFRRGVEI